MLTTLLSVGLSLNYKCGTIFKSLG